MLRKTIIVLAAAAALTAGLTADAFALAAGHGGPFGEFTVQSIEHSDARSQPATESHGGNAARLRKPHHRR
jgi:ABC-type phosphate/phosphonate transport system permease subunit